MRRGAAPHHMEKADIGLVYIPDIHENRAIRAEV